MSINNCINYLALVRMRQRYAGTQGCHIGNLRLWYPYNNIFRRGNYMEAITVVVVLVVVVVVNYMGHVGMGR